MAMSNYREQHTLIQVEPLYPYPYPSHYQHYSHSQPHLYPPQQPNPSLIPNPNPNPNPNPSFNHHQSSLGYSYGENGAQTSAYGGHYAVGNDGLSAYYHDPNWVATGSVEVYGANPVLYSNPNVNYGANPVLYSNPNGGIVPPNGAQQYVTPNFDHSLGTNQAAWHHRSNSFKKRLKKANIPLSVRCDVCKIVCDTQDVLDKHRLGKKHKKNLEKLKAVVAGAPTVAPNGSVNLVTSVQEAPNTSKLVNEQTSKKKALSHSDDLETKRRKILNCGTAIDSVRTCSVCNIVCNSETVFQSHLAGQKHASMLKKQASSTQPGLPTSS